MKKTFLLQIVRLEIGTPLKISKERKKEWIRLLTVDYDNIKLKIAVEKTSA